MLDYSNPELLVQNNIESQEGTIRWRSPSNLALIKYWGKFGRQYPRNPSISFTLDHAFTDTQLQYLPKKDPGRDIELEFFF